MGNECADHAAALEALGFVSNHNVSARWAHQSFNIANLVRECENTTKFSTVFLSLEDSTRLATIICCEVATCPSACLAVLHSACSTTPSYSTLLLRYARWLGPDRKMFRPGQVVVTTPSLLLDLLCALACLLSLHGHPCTRLHPLSPMTKNTTFGTQSLGYVVISTLESTSRRFLLKKGEELQYHVALRWIFFATRAISRLGHRRRHLWLSDLPPPRPLGAPSTFALSGWVHVHTRQFR